MFFDFFQKTGYKDGVHENRKKIVRIYFYIIITGLFVEIVSTNEFIPTSIFLTICVKNKSS
jgi:hypothetical protein